MKTSSPSPRTQIARLKRKHEDEMIRQSEYHTKLFRDNNEAWGERMASQRDLFEVALGRRDQQITDLLIKIEETEQPKKPSLWASAKSWWATLRWTFRNP
jgi:hypothetical protein